jgi:hypothetical protein
LFYNLSMPKSTYRPRVCKICTAPLTQQRRGRPRVYCSDRCRQRKRRRYDYNKWIIPRRHDQIWRMAGRALKQIERHQGPFDTTPLNTTGTYTERWRVQHRLSIGMTLPWCHHCHHFYIETLPGANHQYCSSTCRKTDRERKQAVTTGLLLHADHLNWQVLLRAERDWPLRACDHCGIPFPFDNLRRKFCTDACRKAHWRIEQRMKTRKCAVCHIPFEPDWNNRARHIYCSEACRRSVSKSREQARKLAERQKPRPCAECGKKLIPARRSQKYHFGDCQKRASNRALQLARASRRASPSTPADQTRSPRKATHLKCIPEDRAFCACAQIGSPACNFSTDQFR